VAEQEIKALVFKMESPFRQTEDVILYTISNLREARVLLI
jgi:hypothetical protein